MRGSKVVGEKVTCGSASNSRGKGILSEAATKEQLPDEEEEENNDDDSKK